MKKPSKKFVLIYSEETMITSNFTQSFNKIHLIFRNNFSISGTYDGYQ